MATRWACCPGPTPERVARAITEEWGQGLIRSWNSAGWFDLPQRLGDKIAHAGRRAARARWWPPTAPRSTSTRCSAPRCASAPRRAPARRVIVSERSNFPTDLYIAQSLCQRARLPAAAGRRRPGRSRLSRDDVAVLMLTHVNYRTGAMHDMAGAHGRGAPGRRAGRVGPGAQRGRGAGRSAGAPTPTSPSAAATNTSTAARARRPSCGFIPAMRTASSSRWPAGGAMPRRSNSRPTTARRRASRATCAAPSRSSAWRRSNAASTRVLAAQPLGGMAALRRKSLALTDLFIRLVEERCAGHGLALVTPRDA